ncbi:MAG: response regulator, partial [Proteobacteria bacterium]|nr:response regulator [Pseudomonadota bacterium]
MSEAKAGVLVVEDERFFREAIAEALVEDGFQCTMVEDGETALTVVEEEPVGVVVLDIRLPGIDGIEVLRRLRDVRPSLRVIILSAHTDQELVLEALRLGACDYLAKPLHDEELVLAVRRAAESFSIANGWSCLRGRLDRLCSHMEDLSRSLASCDSEERQPLVEARAAEAACDVLGAQRTAFMLLSEDRTQ